MPVPSEDKTQEELKARSERIAALRQDFSLQMTRLRGRQRALLERVIKRMDEEEAEKIRKSLQ